MQGQEAWYVPEWSVIQGRVARWWSFPTEQQAREFSQSSAWYGAPQRSGLCVHCRDALPPEGECFCKSTWSGGHG